MIPDMMPLTIEVERFSGEEKIADGLYRGFWCERCRRYSVWPGPDWGESHYFCEDCLETLELGKYPLSDTYVPVK